MARWLIEVCGEKFDTEEVPYWFPDGEAYAFAEKDDVLLTGNAFEACADPGEVHELADRIIDEFYAVTCLLQAGAKRPTVGKICREADDGTRTGYFLHASPGHFRKKLREMRSVDAWAPASAGSRVPRFSCATSRRTVR